MKVIVIGPVAPYRGGIVHSNIMLCENLAKNHDLLSISFSRLYPKLLYPGKFQKEQKSAKLLFKSIELLDSINPLTWENCVQLIKRKKPDHVIFQWVHPFFMPCYTYIALRIKKVTIVSVYCQNVLPHEGSRIHPFLTKLFFSQAHHLITLSHSDTKILKKFLPRARINFLIEPTTEKNFCKQRWTRQKAKQKLGIKGKVILFFGFVRPYKGLRYLLEGLPTVLQKFSDLKLLIVGEFWKDKEDYLALIQKLGIQKNLLIVDNYVSNEAVPMYFAAANAVVLPYLSSTESGIIQLAYGLNLPVITTAVGGNVDFISHKKTGMLCKPKDSQDLARVIIEFFEENLEPIIKRGMKENESVFKWTSEKERILFDQQ